MQTVWGQDSGEPMRRLLALALALRDVAESGSVDEMREAVSLCLGFADRMVSNRLNQESGCGPNVLASGIGDKAPS